MTCSKPRSPQEPSVNDNKIRHSSWELPREDLGRRGTDGLGVSGCGVKKSRSWNVRRLFQVIKITTRVTLQILSPKNQQERKTYIYSAQKEKWIRRAEPTSNTKSNKIIYKPQVMMMLEKPACIISTCLLEGQHLTLRWGQSICVLDSESCNGIRGPYKPEVERGRTKMTGKFKVFLSALRNVIKWNWNY